MMKSSKILSISKNDVKATFFVTHNTGYRKIERVPFELGIHLTLTFF